MYIWLGARRAAEGCDVCDDARGSKILQPQDATSATTLRERSSP